MQYRVINAGTGNIPPGAPYGNKKQFTKPMAVKINSHRQNQNDFNDIRESFEDGGAIFATMDDQRQHVMHSEIDNVGGDSQFDESEIFNDVLEGGGVDPSIDDTIRDSIKYSFVSSEGFCEPDPSMRQGGSGTTTAQNTQKDTYVMNRMNWITYLKVLFDELESFSQATSQAKQKHVEQGNFVKALRKIKNMLPLLPKLEYMKSCGEVAFSYREVEQVLLGSTVPQNLPMMPKYLTWDNVIDMFLARQTLIQPQTVYHVQPFQSTNFNHLMTEESMISAEVNLKEEEDQSSRVNKAAKIHNPIPPKQQPQQNDKIRKAHPKNEEFFLSFADSVIKMNTEVTGGNVTASQESQKQQVMLAQAPLLMNKPQDEEACEIDSDSENGEAEDDDDYVEESKQKAKKTRQRSELEESVRSSRTANFKQTGGAPQQNNQATNQSNVFTTMNTQDSICGGQGVQLSQQTLLSGISVGFANQKKQILPYNVKPPIEIESALSYYKSAQASAVFQEEEKKESRSSSRRSFKHDDNEHVGMIVSQSISKGVLPLQNLGSQPTLKHAKTSLNNAKDYETLSNTLIKGSVASQSQQSVVSAAQSYHSANTVTPSASNFVDLDMQGKGLRNLEINSLQKQQNLNDKQKMVLRSINVAQNCLQRFPPALEKSLQFLNISHNKLKSLIGIDSCINLKFLNASHNHIASAQGIVLLQSLRELILSNNMISLLKEIGQLKNLVLLDLSYNRLIGVDKLTPLASLRKLQTLVLTGNLLQQKTLNYEASVKKVLPIIGALDPDQVKDFSQFQELEHICFPQIDTNSEEYDGQSMLQFNDRLQLDFSDKDLPVIIAQSSTPIHQETQLIFSQKQNDRSRTPKKQNMKFTHALKSPMRAKNTSNQNSAKQKQEENHYGVRKNELQISQELTKGKKQLSIATNNLSKSRDRSTSNNKIVPQPVKSARTTIQLQFGKVNSKKDIIKVETSKDINIDKRMSANVSLAKAICAQNLVESGRNTPNQHQQSASVSLLLKASHQSRKAFNRTTNISDIALQDVNLTTNLASDRQSHASLADTSQNQSTLSLRNQSRQVAGGAKYVKRSYIDVSQQAYSSVASSKSKSVRPVTQLKKRAGTSQKKEETQLDQQQLDHNLSVQPFSYYQPPLSARHPNGSFISDSREDVSKEEKKSAGRLTPIQQYRQQAQNSDRSRQSTQLQRFINASKSASRQQSQTPTSMQHSQIQQKLVSNLPPRAYQSRLENPGEKKSKSDMSHSIVSSSGGNHTSSANALGGVALQTMSQQSLSNHFQSVNVANDLSKSNYIMQTGGTLNDEEDDDASPAKQSVQYYKVQNKPGGSSGGSMSPVCDETINAQKDSKRQSRK